MYDGKIFKYSVGNRKVNYNVEKQTGIWEQKHMAGIILKNLKLAAYYLVHIFKQGRGRG